MENDKPFIPPTEIAAPLEKRIEVLEKQVEIPTKNTSRILDIVLGNCQLIAKIDRDLAELEDQHGIA